MRDVKVEMIVDWLCRVSVSEGRIEDDIDFGIQGDWEDKMVMSLTIMKKFGRGEGLAGNNEFFLGFVEFECP